MVRVAAAFGAGLLVGVILGIRRSVLLDHDLYDWLNRHTNVTAGPYPTSPPTTPG